MKIRYVLSFSVIIIQVYLLPRFEENSNEILLELIPKPLSTTIGCKVRGSVLSAKKVLDVPKHASEPFGPPALPPNFSLDLVTKQVLGWVLVFWAGQKCNQQ